MVLGPGGKWRCGKEVIPDGVGLKALLHRGVAHDPGLAAAGVPEKPFADHHRADGDQGQIQHQPAAGMKMADQTQAETDEGDTGAGKGQAGAGLGHPGAQAGEHRPLLGVVGPVAGQVAAAHYRRETGPARAQFAGAGHLAGAGEAGEILLVGDGKHGGAAGGAGIDAGRQPGFELAGRQVPFDSVVDHDAADYQERHFQKQQPAVAEDAQKEQGNGDAGNAGADEGETGSALGQQGPVVGEKRTAAGQVGADPGQGGTPGTGGETGVDVLVVLDNPDQISRAG